jgi:hypothetical protein
MKKALIISSFLPAKQVGLITIIVLTLTSFREAGASLFAGNLPPYQKTNASCGSVIYRNAHEYYARQGECVGDEQTKLRVTGFLANSALKIKATNDVSKVSLDSLWGFRQGEHAFRVFNGRIYQILADDSVVIYRGFGKYYRKHYFSWGIDGKVHWFSKRNLKSVLSESEHQTLVRALEEVPAHRLLQYDACTQKFLIQHLLTKNSP